MQGDEADLIFTIAAIALAFLAPLAIFLRHLGKEGR